MKNYNADLNVILEATRKASVQIIKDFYEIEKLQVSKKGIANFVTNTDLSVERTLVYHLQRNRPDYDFLTEESEKIDNTKIPQYNEVKYKWIIDPIDGTFNFMHGIPFFCISIALAKITQKDSSIILGVIHNPISNETFWGAKKIGAFLIDSLGIQRKIKVAQHNNYERIIYATHDYLNSSKKLKQCQKYLYSKHSKARILGASALELAYLADGRINLFVQGKLNIWDYAAGLIIIREAGGVVKDLNQKDLTLNLIDGIIAGNKKLVNEIETSY